MPGEMLPGYWYLSLLNCLDNIPAAVLADYITGHKAAAGKQYCSFHFKLIALYQLK